MRVTPDERISRSTLDRNYGEVAAVLARYFE
jgi:hypothetical protein